MKTYFSRHSYNATHQLAARFWIPLVAAIVFLGASTSSHAEVEKFATPSASGMHLYWWPRVPAVEGWIQDRDASAANSIFALVPTGQSFQDAPTVIYAKAVFKARVPDLTSLSAFVEDDKKGTLANAPGTTAVSAKPMTDGDGRGLVSLVFRPRSDGNWEQVSYLEEGEFYLVFAVSARNEAAFNSARTSYEWLVSHYKEHP